MTGEGWLTVWIGTGDQDELGDRQRDELIDMLQRKARTFTATDDYVAVQAPAEHIPVLHAWVEEHGSEYWFAVQKPPVSDAN